MDRQQLHNCLCGLNFDGWRAWRSYRREKRLHIGLRYLYDRLARVRAGAWDNDPDRREGGAGCRCGHPGSKLAGPPQS